MSEKYKSVIEKLSECYKPHKHNSNIEKIIKNEKIKYEKKTLNTLQSNKKFKPETTLYDKDEHVIKIYDGESWHVCTPGFVLKALKYKDKIEQKTIYDDLEHSLEQ